MIGRPGVEAKKLLGQILIDGAFITPEELEAALTVSRSTGNRLGEVLVEQGRIAPETLATTLSFQLGVPVVDLKHFRIQTEALRLIPEEVARAHNVLPLELRDNALTVAMDEPQDVRTLDALAAISHRSIRPVIPLYGGIREAIRANYTLTPRLQETVSSIVGPEAARMAPEPLLRAEVISQAPVVRAVEMIISQAVSDRASDIHIEPQKDGLRIRYRIDGILHDVVTLPLGVHAALLSRIKVQANMNIAERRRPQNGRFASTVNDRQVDFRVATIETNHGEMAVLRVLDKSASLFQLDELGILRDALEVYQRVLQSPFGMIPISGPTGSGKTTTLYASVNQLNVKERNIMTIEDPIEYHFEDINQIQVNRPAGIDFATGLKAIMRLDPDVILVGEIRDIETAATAVQAALTGHLVITSVHANDAVGALLRLIDLGMEPFLVVSGVIATVAQRLVRRVCPYCRVILPAPAAEAMAYQEEMQEVRTDFYYGRGCNFCSHTGFQGRTGVFEVMPLTDKVRQLITRHAPAAEVKAAAMRDGMITMRRDGMIKARNGVTTPGEVIRNVFSIGYQGSAEELRPQLIPPIAIRGS